MGDKACNQSRLYDKNLVKFDVADKRVDQRRVETSDHDRADIPDRDRIGDDLARQTPQRRCFNLINRCGCCDCIAGETCGGHGIIQTSDDT